MKLVFLWRVGGFLLPVMLLIITLGSCKKETTPEPLLHTLYFNDCSSDNGWWYLDTLRNGAGDVVNSESVSNGTFNMYVRADLHDRGAFAFVTFDALVIPEDINGLILRFQIVEGSAFTAPLEMRWSMGLYGRYYQGIVELGSPAAGTVEAITVEEEEDCFAVQTWKNGEFMSSEHVGYSTSSTDAIAFQFTTIGLGEGAGIDLKIDNIEVLVY